jgi:hypothetical protein
MRVGVLYVVRAPIGRCCSVMAMSGGSANSKGSSLFSCGVISTLASGLNSTLASGLSPPWPVDLTPHWPVDFSPPWPVELTPP